jgi:hypothetical protein
MQIEDERHCTLFQNSNSDYSYSETNNNVKSDCL